MNSAVKISVIIATYNRKRLLARTLPTLFQQDLPATDYEIVIVIDGSSDGTIELLRSYHPACSLRILEQENRGQPIAYNTGIEAARGELLLLLDDDILCDPTLLSEHANAHSNLDKTVVSGPVWIASESPANTVTDWMRRMEADYRHTNRSVLERSWPADTKLDANTSIKRAALIDCGGFAPEFAKARCDLELGLRLHRVGFRFVNRPTAIGRQIYIKPVASLLSDDARAYGENELLLCRNYPEYRSVSALARINEGGLLKRTVRRVAVRSPIWPEALFTRAFSAIERFRSVPFLREASLRALQAVYTCSLIRSAARSSGSWPAFRSEFGVHLPVLLYHHIGPVRGGTFTYLTVSPENFERQMAWLSRHGYHGITPSDWLRWCREGKALPAKPILLTFDDGYADLAEHAFPVLERYGFPAAVYVVTSQLGGTNLWDQQSGSAAHRLLSAEEIRLWAGRGIEFGSHSHSHPDMNELTQAELDCEVSTSQNELASLSAKDVVSFAYPYGGFDQTITRAVRKRFQIAFTTDVGLNCLASDLLSMRRSTVTAADSLLDLRLRVKLGWNPIEGVRRRIA